MPVRSARVASVIPWGKPFSLQQAEDRSQLDKQFRVVLFLSPHFRNDRRPHFFGFRAGGRHNPTLLGRQLETGDDFRSFFRHESSPNADRTL